MKYPRPTKEEYRPLFLALQADCKSFPGGITALAERIGVTKFTLASAVNPDQTNASPPSLGVLLEVITLAQARRTVFELCHLVGQIPIDVDVEESSARDSVHLFLALTQKASNGCSSSSFRSSAIPTLRRSF